MESILDSIKKLLGIQKEYTHFDTDLIIHINTTFTILNQLGVGPSNGFFISDDTAVWNDFMNNDNRLESVKTFVYLKVRLLFDPPTNSALIESINHIISELEWRLSITTKEENKHGVQSNRNK